MLIRDSLVDALSMKEGNGEHSYDTNSHYQVTKALYEEYKNEIPYFDNDICFVYREVFSPR